MSTTLKMVVNDKDTKQTELGSISFGLMDRTLNSRSKCLKSGLSEVT